MSDSRADQILAAFVDFHGQNPEVWRLFQRFALEAVESGRAHYSARTLIDRIRWHVEIETRGDELKINNNFGPYYARLFHRAHPEHDGFFRNRLITTAAKPAAYEDQQVFFYGPPGDERKIAATLDELLRGDSD